jgi:hypothetical protein
MTRSHGRPNNFPPNPQDYFNPHLNMKHYKPMSASMFLATAATPLRPGDGNADVLENISIRGSLPMNSNKESLAMQILWFVLGFLFLQFVLLLCGCEGPTYYERHHPGVHYSVEDGLRDHFAAQAQSSCQTTESNSAEQLEDQSRKLRYLQEQLDDITNRHPGL